MHDRGLWCCFFCSLKFKSGPITPLTTATTTCPSSRLTLSPLVSHSIPITCPDTFIFSPRASASVQERGGGMRQKQKSMKKPLPVCTDGRLAQLTIPDIRRVLQQIRMRWRQDSFDGIQFSPYQVVHVRDGLSMTIQRFCFYFVADKYSRRHRKYISKRRRLRKAVIATGKGRAKSE